jgi:hypothetical protein
VDDKIKQLLQDLGTAINESISSSHDVNRHIQLIRDEGYDLYVVLDATIGLNKQEPDEETDHHSGDQPSTALVPVAPIREVQFRINVNDLNMLRSVGIDPTRKVKATRRVAPLAQPANDD